MSCSAICSPDAFLHRIPAYLTTAFPIGSEEILRPATVLIALGCGVLATMLASLSPALDLRPSRPTDAALRDREGGSEVIAARHDRQGRRCSAPPPSP